MSLVILFFFFLVVVRAVVHFLKLLFMFVFLRLGCKSRIKKPRKQWDPNEIKWGNIDNEYSRQWNRILFTKQKSSPNHHVSHQSYNKTEMSTFFRACMRAIFLIVCERICKRDQLYSKFPQYIYRFLGDLTFSYFGGAWTRGRDNHQHIHTQKWERNETETKTEIVNKRQWSISACFCSNKVVSFCLFVLIVEMNEAAIHSKHCWPISKLNSIKNYSRCWCIEYNLGQSNSNGIRSSNSSSSSQALEWIDWMFRPPSLIS